MALNKQYKQTIGAARRRVERALKYAENGDDDVRVYSLKYIIELLKHEERMVSDD